ncbi:MAG: hypothetical protein IJ009_06010 [Clostridia bacterium]|nr:hypothetical protein [Clostridia bacterium]
MEKSKYCLTMSKNNLKNRDMWDKKVNFNDIIAILNVNKTKKATENCFFDRFFCVEKRKKQRFSQSARGFCAIFLLDFPRQMC